MFFKSIPLLISLAQAAKILQPPNPHIASAQSARVNGTLTSFTIIEGSGCPAGSYHAVPISPGASLNTYVDVDPSIYAYNSTTSTAPASCTFLIDFEFVFPEDGVAEINLDTITYNDAQFEDGDGNKTTNFKANFDMVVAMSGTEGFNVSQPSVALPFFLSRFGCFVWVYMDADGDVGQYRVYADY
jgi:hypothetical protein